MENLGIKIYKYVTTMKYTTTNITNIIETILEIRFCDKIYIKGRMH